MSKEVICSELSKHVGLQIKATSSLKQCRIDTVLCVCTFTFFGLYFVSDNKKGFHLFSLEPGSSLYVKMIWERYIMFG